MGVVASFSTCILVCLVRGVAYFSPILRLTSWQPCRQSFPPRHIAKTPAPCHCDGYVLPLSRLYVRPAPRRVDGSQVLICFQRLRVVFTRYVCMSCLGNLKLTATAPSSSIIKRLLSQFTSASACLWIPDATTMLLKQPMLAFDRKRRGLLHGNFR